MFFTKRNNLKGVISCLIFAIVLNLSLKTSLVLAISEESFNFSGFLKDWLEKTKIYKLFPELYLKLTATIAQVPSESQKFIPQPMKDLSSFNLSIDKYYRRPWEVSGLVECEPWGVGNGKTICLAPVFPGDPPCPIFMDCDGDGHFWWKGEDCDENCPTCYVGSKFYTEEPDGRDQDCDGLTDDNVECIPRYGASKNFGYDPTCNFTSNTNYVLVNEGEVGEIPIDEVHCQKRWGQCTDYQGGFGNCTVKKTPGYFVKSNGIACGGGVWRAKGSNAIFDCGKALREESYKGTYGCNMDCCKYKYVCEEREYGIYCYCSPVCVCEPSVCSFCQQCQELSQTASLVCRNGCPYNAAFEYGSGGDKGQTPPPPSPSPRGVPSALFKIFSKNPFAPQIASSAIQYGPWGLCHGYNEYLCQEMTGCERKFVENRYY